MMNSSKKILSLVVVLCSLQVSFGQDVDLTTQSVEIASMNLKEITEYVDEVKASLESGSLSLEEEQLNTEKLKTLSVLQQAAADILRDLLSQADLDEVDSLVENAQQVGEIAKQVYAEQVAPTLQAVFEIMDDTSDVVATEVMDDTSDAVAAEVMDDSSDAVAEGQSIGVSGEMPNIYANIGQTPVYQAVMNELHNTFRQSATTPEGGGFGETDATPN